ncbi:RINT-1 family protein [Phanerochaete sordida]|uniref:RINT-1 family protein n=1 Tax=Phanerochaete sordida TaxID=48140 RepID=A0A9P3L8B3_9APHY|nr:RINT-1 family protein [Phanerochaete sordida]
MSSAQIQALLDPPSASDAHQRTKHYLNVRFKTFQDVQDSEEFDELVSDASKRNNELKGKLVQSQSEVDLLITNTRSTAQEHLHTAQELSLLRHSLADELSYLSQELVSSLSGPEGMPTLLEDIETLHRNLKELQSVKSYIQVVEHALQIGETAVLKAKSTSPFDCIPQYEQLQAFVAKVSVAGKQVEDAAGQQKLHLVSFLESIQDRTWNDVKAVFSSTLQTIAEKLQWPLPVNYAIASQEDRKAFESAFYNLLKLQSIGEKLHASAPRERTERDGLYPLQALVHPVSLRFKYHFESTRQTNRLDKPEWYFTHILNVSHEHRPFMESVVQPLLARTEFRGTDAWREFTLLLLPLLARKLRKTVPALIAHPPVLAHTIYQALAFDSSLRDEGFELAGTSAAGEGGRWQGVSEVILGRKDWFEAWMEGERAFAMDQYMEIISSQDAWLIADDSEDGEEESTIDRELKPTNSARKVKALVEQVTDRYSPLPQFIHRTRFLITVQLPLLESYHARISSSLDAFETLSSTLMRAVPGALGTDVGRLGDSRRLTSGVEGVQRLCKALVSAKYVAAAMEAWGEDLFFLELWTEINHKAALRARAEAAASLPDPKGAAEEEAPEGTIFEELVTQYGKLVTRAEDMIVHSVCNEVEAGLRQHFQSGGSAQNTPTSGTDADAIALPPTLLAPIALLSSQLTFLQGALPPSTAAALYRRIAAHLATHILQRALLYRGRGRVPPAEGRAITAECELWASTCRHALPRMPHARVEAPWRGLLQAARVVGATGAVWARVVDATLGTAGDEEWEAAMLELVGFAELTREEVGQIVRTRTDCER